MSWTEVFTDVPWANGDYVTETKMDQMVANDKYLREQVSFSTLVTDTLFFQHWLPGGWALQLRQFAPTLKIDATTDVLAPSTVYLGSSWEDFIAKDVSISSTAEGLHTLDLSIEGDNNDSPYFNHVDDSDVGKYQFVKTQEIEYLSIWARAKFAAFHSGDTDAKLIVQLTVLGHRASQGW